MIGRNGASSGPASFDAWLKLLGGRGDQPDALLGGPSDRVQV